MEADLYEFFIQLLVLCLMAYQRSLCHVVFDVGTRSHYSVDTYENLLGENIGVVARERNIGRRSYGISASNTFVKSYHKSETRTVVVPKLAISVPHTSAVAYILLNRLMRSIA